MQKEKSYRTNLIYQKLLFLKYNSFPREKELGLTKQMHTHYFPDLVMLFTPFTLSYSTENPSPLPVSPHNYSKKKNPNKQGAVTKGRNWLQISGI